jgi:hypothetical protein
MIAAARGGTVAVGSRLGVGSTFTIRFPEVQPGTGHAGGGHRGRRSVPSDLPIARLP